MATSARVTYEGTLTFKRYAKPHRSRRWSAPITYYAPVGWIHYPESDEHPRGWQVRFRQLPEALHQCDGHRVRVTCTPDYWPNGLGFYATRSKVECLDEAEHVLTALASLAPKATR